MGSLNKKKRIKYNYEFIITDKGDLDKFEDYVSANNLRQHINGKKTISRNRLARAFCRRFYDWYQWTFIIHSPCYIVGQEERFSDWLQRMDREILGK